MQLGADAESSTRGKGHMLVSRIRTDRPDETKHPFLNEINALPAVTVAIAGKSVNGWRIAVDQFFLCEGVAGLCEPGQRFVTDGRSLLGWAEGSLSGGSLALGWKRMHIVHLREKPRFGGFVTP